jgi:hypothetical protein
VGPVGLEVAGDSECDIGSEDDMGSTTEIGGIYKGPEELESEEPVLEEKTELEEVQITSGIGRCNLEDTALSLPSEDSSYLYL